MTPAWILDANKLRSTLDSIRERITHSAGSSAAELASVMLHDKDAIFASVRAVVEAASSIDLSARRSLAGFVAEYRQPDQAARIESLLSQLQAAWSTRLRSRFAAEKATALRALLVAPSADFLRVLDRTYDENSHSHVIRWLLDPRTAPSIASHALRALVSKFDDSTTWLTRLDHALRNDLVSVKREFTIGREWGGDALDRIDLVVSAPGFVIAIENKVRAEEGRSQTWAYWRWLATTQGLRGGIFLSPAGSAPECSHFRAVSYLDLLDCLLEAPVRGALSADERGVLSSYLRTLANSMLRSEFRELLREGDRR